MAALRALILCLDRPLAVEAFCFHRDANWQVRQSLVAKSLAAIFLCKVGGEVSTRSKAANLPDGRACPH